MFSRSKTISRIFGIELRVHATFAIVVGIAAVVGAAKHGLAGAAFGAVIVLALFACVLLHELAHAAVARAFGLTVPAITLLPIGGVAEMTESPRRPMHELWIALAGPAMSALIGFMLLAAVHAHPSLAGIDGAALVEAGAFEPSLGAALLWLAHANLTLAVFNLIPAFPMDGGRVLRALLATRLGVVRATRIAVPVGQAVAVVLGLFGLFGGNLLLALVAVFVYFGAAQERAAVELRHSLDTLRAADLCKPVPTIDSSTSIEVAAAEALLSPHREIPVVIGRRIVGFVRREGLAMALQRGLGADPVRTVLLPALQVSSHTSVSELRTVFDRFRADVVAVSDRLGLVGIVDRNAVTDGALATR